MIRKYTLIIEGDGARYSGYVPELPTILVTGSSIEDPTARAKEAIGLYAPAGCGVLICGAGAGQVLRLPIACAKNKTLWPRKHNRKLPPSTAAPLRSTGRRHYGTCDPLRSRPQPTP